MNPGSVANRFAGCTPHSRPVELVGESSSIAAVKELISAIAPRDSTILINGETGTGKDLFARRIHENSPRALNPFIAVDCSTLSETIADSQLFGHVRGAFTGALRDTLGFVRSADGGTLFLDELGELSAISQAKLLRVLQERTVVAVGDTRPRPVNVRVIAATNRDLAQMVRDGQFRQDLYFRINVVSIQLPPLRERPEDILPLARHFLNLQANHYGEPAKGLDPQVENMLAAYDWPGNIRELANAMERAHVISTGPVVLPAALPDTLAQAQAGADGLIVTGDLHLASAERRLIIEALRQTNFNKAAASRKLGIDVKRLRRKIANLAIGGIESSARPPRI